jgi:hypothetical protein
MLWLYRPRLNRPISEMAGQVSTRGRVPSKVDQATKRQPGKGVPKINAEAKEVSRTTANGIEGPARIQSSPVIRTETRALGFGIQTGRLRDKIKTDPDAGLHPLRHTFLTGAGEYTDVFTLQYIAAHDTHQDRRCGMCTLGRSQSAGCSVG